RGDHTDRGAGLGNVGRGASTERGSRSAASSLAAVEVLESNANLDAIAEVRRQLDAVATIRKMVLAPLHALVDLVRVEQAKEVQRNVVAEVHDRADLAGGQDGGVTDRDVSAVDHDRTGRRTDANEAVRAIGAEGASRETSSRAAFILDDRILLLLQLDHGAGRTKV